MQHCIVTCTVLRCTARVWRAGGDAWRRRLTDSLRPLLVAAQMAIHRDAEADVTRDGYTRFLCASPLVRVPLGGASRRGAVRRGRVLRASTPCVRRAGRRARCSGPRFRHRGRRGRRGARGDGVRP